MSAGQATADLRTPLPGSPSPLAEAYDVALLDLDGVCFAGDARIDHAADGVNGAREAGMRLSFVTNNAFRAPSTVVDKLSGHGIVASAGEVFSAAMDGAALLREHLEPGAPVLVVGGDGLVQALEDEGYVVVASAEDHPAAVVQGWAPQVDWAMLSEGAYAIRAGALHVATNTDATLPTERGFALGNGSLVAAVANATGQPYLAGGKPFPGIYRRALARAGGKRPLAVGDRLDTDVVGARAAGIDALHVLTGVSSAAQVLSACREQRPTYLHTDLRGLLEGHPAARPDGEWWAVGQARARVVDGLLEVSGLGTLGTASALTGARVELSLNQYRAAAAAVWAYSDGADADAAHAPVQVPDVHVTPAAPAAAPVRADR